MPAFTDHFQDDIVARISLDALFADSLVIQERKGLASDQVAMATAGELPADSGKFGRYVIVEMPVRLPDEITVQVLVRAIPKFIGTEVDAHELVWNQSDRIEQLFQSWSNGPKTLNVRNIAPYSDNAGIIGYDAEIYWERQIEPITAPEIPTIRAAGLTVTLGCPTPGAEIRYTTDGTFPAPTATLYAAPFLALSGALIRAAAYLDGQAGSGTARRRI